MENIKQQFARLYMELDLTDDQAAMIHKLQKDVNAALGLAPVSGSLCFSEHEIDFAYLCGVFNVSGIDGLHKEIQRLKELGKEPHDIIDLEEFKSNMLKLTGADELDVTYDSVDENEYEEEEEVI